MKVMVFDVGGTEIKYSVMDEQMNRFDAGSVPTPQDTQEHFLDTIYALYAPHKDEVDGIAMALPALWMPTPAMSPTAGHFCTTPARRWGSWCAKDAAAVSRWKTTGKAAAIAELRGRCLAGLLQCGSIYYRHRRGGGIIANGQLVRGVHFTPESTAL